MIETLVEELEGSNVSPDPPEGEGEAEAERELPEADEAEEDETLGVPGPARLSRKGANFIARFEGCILHLYNDPTKNATIGIGHLVHMGPINGSESAEFKRGITRERALELLEQDAKGAAQAVRQAITHLLKQTELDALISFAFNVGAGNLRSSTLRRKLNAGDRAAVPSELMKWVNSAGKKLPGLVRRRQAEGALFAHGKYN
jgi:lysozyme